MKNDPYYKVILENVEMKTKFKIFLRSLERLITYKINRDNEYEKDKIFPCSLTMKMEELLAANNNDFNKIWENDENTYKMLSKLLELKEFIPQGVFNANINPLTNWMVKQEKVFSVSGTKNCYSDMESQRKPNEKLAAILKMQVELPTTFNLRWDVAEKKLKNYSTDLVNKKLLLNTHYYKDLVINEPTGAKVKIAPMEYEKTVSVYPLEYIEYIIKLLIKVYNELKNWKKMSLSSTVGDIKKHYEKYETTTWVKEQFIVKTQKKVSNTFDEEIEKGIIECNIALTA